MTGPAERFSKWGGAQWRNIWGGGGRAIFARERSDRGAGASIHFSDWRGGQKLEKFQNCVRKISLQYNTARIARRKIENCVCLVLFKC